MKFESNLGTLIKFTSRYSVRSSCRPRGTGFQKGLKSTTSDMFQFILAGGGGGGFGSYHGKLQSLVSGEI